MQTVNNSLTTQKKVPMAVYLAEDAVKNHINSILGSKRGTRFITTVVSMVNANPALKECTNESILSAALQGESLNLSCNQNLGQWYPVPYKNKKKGCKEAQFQMGYKGYIQLALRTGQYKDIDVMEIREGEYKGRDGRTGKPKFEFIEDDEERESKPVIGYMAYFEYLNGFTKILYWAKEKMMRHADKYSQAFSLNATSGKYPKVSYVDYVAGKYSKEDEWLYSSYWYTDFDGMAFKTMLRQLISKWGMMSEEMQSALEKDMGVIRENGIVDYVDNDTEYIEPEPPAIEPPTPEKNEQMSMENPAMTAMFGGQS